MHDSAKKISGNNNSWNKSSFCTSNVVVEAVVVVVVVAAAVADVLHDPDDIESSLSAKTEIWLGKVDKNLIYFSEWKY